MENKINLTQLRQLLGDDEAMVSRFLELFKSEMPKQLAALEEQLENGDYAEANVTAHGIKGQLLTMGLSDLAEIALEIENRTDNEINADSHFFTLNQNIQNLLKSLTTS
jgi:HPt (histidine-containing phosphotransfer) domain-containing protein